MVEEDPEDDYNDGDYDYNHDILASSAKGFKGQYQWGIKGKSSFNTIPKGYGKKSNSSCPYNSFRKPFAGKQSTKGFKGKSNPYANGYSSYGKGYYNNHKGAYYNTPWGDDEDYYGDDDLAPEDYVVTDDYTNSDLVEIPTYFSGVKEPTTAVVDTGAALSICGSAKLGHLTGENTTLPTKTFRFGDGSTRSSSSGKIIKTVLGDISVYAVDADCPLLLGSDLLKSKSLTFNRAKMILTDGANEHALKMSRSGVPTMSIR